ncbi:MAG TPA: DUF3368 domain-containing protein [Gammaproteobacteria bacterium]|nr:DUF3368 domain-containing protein [Gammaproteobacteria bacterium]
MAKKIIIADAGPLIAFGRIHFLELLPKIVGTIIIPKTVATECLADISKPGALAIQKAITKKIIQVHADIKGDAYDELSDILGEGESLAIELALKLKAGLLIDEKLGRSAAQKRHLKIIGTAGVLLLAKQKKLIKKILPVIQELKKAGYYLSPELIKEIAKQAKEN